MKKIITCAGYHGTGSSLITDLLKEFSNVKSFGEYEFRFLQDPNGVGDLEERLINNNSRLNSDRAIYDFKRFIKKLSRKEYLKFYKKNMYEKIFNKEFNNISNEYVNSLINLSWKGSWHDFDFRDRDFFSTISYFVKRNIHKTFIKIFKKYYFKDFFNMYYSYPSPKRFEELTRNYLENLWKATKIKENILVFDQLVPVCNINKYIKYFNSIKIIVVDRDPRDLYVLNKYFWEDEVVPTDNVDVFIEHFKLLREHQKFEKEDKNIVLKIKFEDTIYDYEKTLAKIINFLEIKEEHINKFKYFNPQKSINITQIFKNNFINQNDIRKIEEKLSEYCYKFPYSLEKQDISKIY